MRNNDDNKVGIKRLLVLLVVVFGIIVTAWSAMELFVTFHWYTTGQWHNNYFVHTIVFFSGIGLIGLLIIFGGVKLAHWLMPTPEDIEKRENSKRAKEKRAAEKAKEIQIKKELRDAKMREQREKQFQENLARHPQINKENNKEKEETFKVNTDAINDPAIIGLFNNSDALNHKQGTPVGSIDNYLDGKSTDDHLDAESSNNYLDSESSNNYFDTESSDNYLEIDRLGEESKYNKAKEISIDSIKLFFFKGPFVLLDVLTIAGILVMVGSLLLAFAVVKLSEVPVGSSMRFVPNAQFYWEFAGVTVLFWIGLFAFAAGPNWKYVLETSCMANINEKLYLIRLKPERIRDRNIGGFLAANKAIKAVNAVSTMISKAEYKTLVKAELDRPDFVNTVADIVCKDGYHKLFEAIDLQGKKKINEGLQKYIIHIYNSWYKQSCNRSIK